MYIEPIRREVLIDGSLPESKQNSILLLNQDLTLGGPALALYNMALCLKRLGYDVVYGSQIDGPLRKNLVESDIPVVIDENMLVATMDECQWVYNFEKIICNTINFHIFLSKRDLSVPVVWWLHDAAFFYEGINRRAMNEIKTDNLTILAVGSISTSALKTYRSDFKIKNFIYGVDDLYQKHRITFVTIGYVEERKGQDVLVKAIRLLPDIIRDKVRFKVIGRKTSAYAKSIIEDSADIDEIEFVGLLNRVDLQNMLKTCDVMICPSREDPMPTVCAEAMMNYIPCIVSDSTGTAGYIENEKSGLIFASEDSEQLAECICWMVDHRNDIKKIGLEARKVYDKEFSMECFNNNVKHLMEALS